MIVRGRHVLTRALDDHRVETFDDAGVLVLGGAIREVAPFAGLAVRFSGLPVMGDADSLVIPGLVDAHHHVGLTPVQLGAPDLPLELWLTWQMRAKSVDPYLDTLYSAFEHVASGVTAVQHLGRMLPAPVSAWPDEAAAVIAAYRDLGLRVSFALCTRDQHRLAYAEDAVFLETLPDDLRAEAGAFLKRSHFPLEAFETEYLAPLIARMDFDGDGMARPWLAPINLERASDRMLTHTADLAREYGLGIHLHLSETIYQKEFSRRRFGKSSVAHLAEIGFLGPRLTLGHGTWLDEADLDLIHRHGVCLCHNASSNLRLASGIAPITEVLRRGIPVALGIDEAGLNDDRDMLQEMRLVKHLHAVPGLDAARPTPAQIFRMATETGARAIGFGDRIGTIEAGKRADLVILDYRALSGPYLDAATDPVSALIHRAKTEHVRATIIDGRVVYRDGQHTRVDRAAVMARIRESLDRPLTEAEAFRADLSARLVPHLRAFYRDWDMPFGEPWYRMNGR